VVELSDSAQLDLLSGAVVELFDSAQLAGAVVELSDSAQLDGRNR
jgi:hypothetical protein